MTKLFDANRGGEPAVHLVLTLLGLAAAIVGSRYGLFTPQGRVGPGLLPAAAGALLAVLGLAQLARSLRRPVSVSPAAGSAPEEPDLLGRSQAQRVRHVWAVFGLLLLAMLAVGVLGFLVSFAALILVISVFVERRRLRGSLLVTAIACAVIYAIFVVFLGVPLPQGVLGL